jgi:hypothetical protein
VKVFLHAFETVLDNPVVLLKVDWSARHIRAVVRSGLERNDTIASPIVEMA